MGWDSLWEFEDIPTRLDGVFAILDNIFTTFDDISTILNNISEIFDAMIPAIFDDISVISDENKRKHSK